MSAGDKLLAEIARKHGGKLLDSVIDKALPATASGSKTVVGTLVGAVALRVASRSVPGAIVVGGGLIAKRLYDRRQQRLGGKVAPAAKDKA